jgi:hypothetical protein
VATHGTKDQSEFRSWVWKPSDGIPFVIQVFALKFEGIEKDLVE